MDYEDIFNKIGRILEFEAKRLYIAGYDFDDLMQEARSSTLKAIEMHGLDESNIQKNHQLIRTFVRNHLLNIWRKQKAQKRVPSKKICSLDAVNDAYRDHRSLLEKIPSGESEIVFSDLMLKRLVKIALENRKPNSIRGVVWYLAFILDLKKEEIPIKIKYQTFISNGLANYLWIFFNNSRFRAINFAYPGEFLRYNFPRVPNRYWKRKIGKKRAIASLREALEKSNYNPGVYPRLINHKFIEEFKLARP